MDRRSPSECQPNGQEAPATAPGWLRLWPLALLLAVAALILFTGAWRHLSLAELRDRRAELTGYVREHPILSLEVYAGLYAVMIAFSIPGALVMSLAGGYLFGVITGATAAVIGETAGATAMFLAARSTLGPWLVRRFGHAGGLLDRFTSAARENAISTLLTLRLIPGVPFTLVNILAGVVHMRVAPYVLVTAIGIAPSTLIYAGVGQGLGHVFKKSGALDPSKLVTPAVYLPVAGLVVLAATPLAWSWWRSRRASS